MVEVGFVLLFLVGLALLVNVPVAMMTGGVIGVVACERWSDGRIQRSQVVESRSERVA